MRRTREGSRHGRGKQRGESTAAGLAGGGATRTNEVVMSAGDTKVTAAALMWGDV